MSHRIDAEVPAMSGSEFGIGAYTPTEAAKLLHMQAVTLRRWLCGYDYDREDGVHQQPPLWRAQYDADQDGLLLGFRDLVEARIVHALRKSRIGLPTIRLCIYRAREMLGEDQPFSTKDLHSDGKRIFLEIQHGDEEPPTTQNKETNH